MIENDIYFCEFFLPLQSDQLNSHIKNILLVTTYWKKSLGLQYVIRIIFQFLIERASVETTTPIIFFCCHFLCHRLKVFWVSLKKEHFSVELLILECKVIGKVSNYGGLESCNAIYEFLNQLFFSCYVSWSCCLNFKTQQHLIINELPELVVAKNLSELHFIDSKEE